MENQTFVEKFKKKEFKLQDSMEFYKKQGIKLDSPPKEETLLVGTDEEDEGNQNEEEAPIIRKSKWFDANDSDSQSENEEGECDLDVNLDQFSDSDEIVFADSDEEAEKQEEKEKEEEKKDPEVIVTPFWFGNEDEEQLRHINSSYYRVLKLGEEKKRLIRQPEPFIGRISRNKVDNGQIFTTIDVVEVYRRSLLPPGSVMPLIRKVHLLTSWSYEDGLPTNFTALDTEKVRKDWRAKIVKDIKPSMLLCLPDYGSNDYHFFVSLEDMEVTHSPSSLHMNEQRRWYEQYIPENFKHGYGEKSGDDDFGGA